MTEEAPQLAPARLGTLRGLEDPAISPEERSFLGAFAEKHRFDPKEVRVASLIDSSGERAGMVVVLPIGLLRSLAERTGKFVGTELPEFVRDGQGVPAAATVRVRRTDLERGVVRTAFWHERSPRIEEGEPLGRWASEPDTMLAEVAEALALRGAFPSVFEGVYTEGDLSEALRDLELSRVRTDSELRRQLEALR
ncbi:MAG: recombinase RecT [Euryarchaeota archaeon]|nr:recombinase RecT [Euryarchaeota archaeon]MDE1835437.1 recombinase RecT [Euryarchaeota archaeon]MDE1879573.1 recombinase RecT [Euryarchaeota archaeon]MDE2046088.1 recombinase RecT [Thermoplasmata archaeon]